MLALHVLAPGRQNGCAGVRPVSNWTAHMNEYELEEIKREIVESRLLTIKTNNLINALSADLKSIAKRQQSYERRFVVNNATAYVVTIAILFILLKFAWDAKLETVRAENKNSQVALEQVTKELKAIQSREAGATRSRRAAAEYYQLIKSNERKAVLDGYEEISRMALTPTEQALFSDAADRARAELSLIAYQNGLDHIRVGRWHEAEQAMSESLRYKRDASHSARATHHLAQALAELGRQREAIPMLMQLAEASADKEATEDATLLLAKTQVDIQAWNDAKGTLRAFLRRFPASSRINDARAMLADLQLYH